ncbi:hypothetical protein Scep_019618 [Stephania cephalantha]|uniref:Uncharacterized protein n=1 Tax=Stephania cephalantha TaxID=152367 RepID=A0AAP0IAZ9_9MAGN
MFFTITTNYHPSLPSPNNDLKKKLTTFAKSLKRTTILFYFYFFEREQIELIKQVKQPSSSQI